MTCDVRHLSQFFPIQACISDLYGDEIVETFYEKEMQKTSQTEFRIEYVIKKRGQIEGL